MKSLKSGLLAMSGLAAVLAMGAGVAQANIVTSFVSATNSVGGGSDWQYSATIDPQQTAKINDFFTIYDFGPQSAMLPAGLLASQFTYTHLAVDPFHAAGQLVTDNSFENIRFTMSSGPDIIGSPVVGTLLGTFTVHSPFAACTGGGCRSVNFDGQAHLTTTGAVSGNSSFVVAPVPGPLVGAGLPGLLAACGGLLALARRRRQKVA